MKSPYRKCAAEVPECQRLGLEDHLITPIQRIPRYCLLLDTLIKKTRADHVDYEPLKEVRVADQEQ